MIEKIGIEIEGAWNDMMDEFLTNGVFRRDGSVDIEKTQQCEGCRDGWDSEYDCECTEGFAYVGELAFEPKITIREALAELEGCYPDYTNKSCGLHVHFSMSDLEYSYIVQNWKKFYNDYFQFLKYWGHSRQIRDGSQFWKRLNGENHYCRKGIDKRTINRQMINPDYDSSRYNHINFSYTKHHTIEFRSAPAFQKKILAVDFVRSLYDFLNLWLASKNIQPIILEIEL